MDGQAKRRPGRGALLESKSDGAYMGNGWLSCIAMPNDVCPERVLVKSSVYLGNKANVTTPALSGPCISARFVHVLSLAGLGAHASF